MDQTKLKKQYEFDAKEHVIGRLAVEVANLLQGKNRPDFQPNQNPMVKVTVFNSDQIKFTGNRKGEGKVYHRYTGFSGGLRERTLNKQMELDSREVIRKAVFNMLPKNRLRSRLMINLQILKDSKVSQ